MFASRFPKVEESKQELRRFLIERCNAGSPTAQMALAFDLFWDSSASGASLLLVDTNLGMFREILPFVEDLYTEGESLNHIETRAEILIRNKIGSGGGREAARGLVRTLIKGIVSNKESEEILLFGGLSYEQRVSFSGKSISGKTNELVRFCVLNLTLLAYLRDVPDDAVSTAVSGIGNMFPLPPGETDLQECFRFLQDAGLVRGSLAEHFPKNTPRFGADVSPLILAVLEKDEEKIRKIAHVMRRAGMSDKEGWNGFHYAVAGMRCKDEETLRIVSTLLDSGFSPDPNISGEFPSEFAAGMGTLPTTVSFLEKHQLSSREAQRHCPSL